MKSQASLPIPDSFRAGQAWGDLLSLFINDLVGGMRLKEAAGRLGVGEPALRHKLDRDAGHVLHAREFFLLLFTATDAQRRALVELIARECGYAIEPIVTRTPEEELADLKAIVVKKLGRVGEEIVASVEGRR